MDAIDYDSVARLYDAYANATYDVAFFAEEVARHGPRVLELTSGTGRLSIPLIEAGATLTCVDLSQGMLDVLAEKMAQRGISAEILCSDATQIPFDAEFDLAIVPFQSFMEFIGKPTQAAVLAAVYRALKSGGAFICTLHNPAVRRQTVDGMLRVVGSFAFEGGTLVVSGVETGGEPVVVRHQYFEFYDADERLVWKRLLPMQFELIERGSFEYLATKQGFGISAVYGHYDRTPFDPQHSPVMIWHLTKGM